MSYNSLEDESLRKSIFENNLRTIKIHNYLFSKNLSSYEMAVNQFSDLVSESMGHSFWFQWAAYLIYDRHLKNFKAWMVIGDQNLILTLEAPT